MLDKEKFAQARADYINNLTTEGKAQYLDILTKSRGRDFAESFVKFVESGDFSELETNIAKLDVGKVEEGGTTVEEEFERTPADVVESMQDDTCGCPVAELVEKMGEEFTAMAPEAKASMVEKLEKAEGKEFAEAVVIAFSDRDFCQYVAKETQDFFDTLAYNFSQAKDKKSMMGNVSKNFSEGVSSAMVDYTLGKMPRNFSVLEAVGLISAVARKNFSENGELADALQELSDGALTPPEAENMATNVEATAPEAVKPLEEAGAVDDAVETMVASTPASVPTGETNPDMSQRNFDAGAGVGGAPVANDVSSIQPETVVREKEQNNMLIDALVEKYKALQTEDAKSMLVADITQTMGEETANYVVARAQGEDFSEEVPNQAEQAISEQPTDEEIAAATPDLNKYEAMAGQLLGPDAYTTSPVASVTTANAPLATATLPEGLPVSEGGTTLAEDYQRDNVVDNYKKLGLI